MERAIESVVLGLMTLIFTIRLLVNAAVWTGHCLSGGVCAALLNQRSLHCHCR
jgi:hypothetical protein